MTLSVGDCHCHRRRQGLICPNCLLTPREPIEVEAAPRWFGDVDPEKLDRICAGLSDEWRAVLTLAMGEPPDEHLAFVAISSTHLNRLRRRLFDDIKMLGYDCASYVSSKAFVWPNVVIGENVFVFEHNVIQHHVAWKRPVSKDGPT